MFAKKIFPPGTFIPLPARIITIVHLCLAFTVLLWGGIQPFMGEYFSQQSSLALYKTVIGDPDLLNKVSEVQRPKISKLLNDNAKRFSQVSSVQRNEIIRHFKALENETKKSFTEKLKRSIEIVLLEMNPFIQLGAILSIILCIMILMRIDGATAAVWLLPLIVAIFALDNRHHSPHTPSSGDAKLFPSEEYIANKYLQNDLGTSISGQRERLLYGWKLYLVNEWIEETPGTNSDFFSAQVEKAEYSFNLARIEARQDSTVKSFPGRFCYRLPIIVLALFFAWNSFFARFISRSKPL